MPQCCTGIKGKDLSIPIFFYNSDFQMNKSLGKEICLFLHVSHLPQK